MGVIDEKGELWLRGRKKEPFFHIEAALHANFEIGRTAIFKDDNELILVLEKSHLIELDDILKSIPFTKIDRIIYINKIPTDKRHSSKVDYIELKKILKKG